MARFSKKFGLKFPFRMNPLWHSSPVFLVSFTYPLHLLCLRSLGKYLLFFIYPQSLIVYLFYVFEICVFCLFYMYMFVFFYVLPSIRNTKKKTTQKTSKKDLFSLGQ